MKEKKGRHKSLGPILKRSVKWLESFESVKKVILGFTEACRHKYTPGHLKVLGDKPGGIKLKAYSGNGVVSIFVKIEPIEDRDEIKSKLEEKFPSN